MPKARLIQQLQAIGGKEPEYHVKKITYPPIHGSIARDTKRGNTVSVRRNLHAIWRRLAEFCMIRQLFSQLFSQIFWGEFNRQVLLRSRVSDRINRPLGIYESRNKGCMVRIHNPRTRTGEKLNEA